MPSLRRPGEPFITVAGEEQRCWFHKLGNVLAALPKSAHPGAKKAIAEVYNAEDRDHARAAANRFADQYGQVAHSSGYG